MATRGSHPPHTAEAADDWAADDAEAAGRLLDMVLEVVAVVRVSRVIGKPIDNLWLSVG